MVFERVMMLKYDRKLCRYVDTGFKGKVLREKDGCVHVALDDPAARQFFWQAAPGFWKDPETGTCRRTIERHIRVVRLLSELELLAEAL